MSPFDWNVRVLWWRVAWLSRTNRDVTFTSWRRIGPLCVCRQPK